MTVKEKILAKPTLVQRVIKARATVISIEDPQPNWEAYTAQALDWWNEMYQDVQIADIHISEIKLAERIIDAHKNHPLWGKLLRHG
jgi:hypothetical protein